MSENTTLFSDDVWNELEKHLDGLKEICYPSTDSIRPVISFKSKKDFQPGDVLKWGTSSSPLSPDELKYIYEGRQELQNVEVDYILVDKNKWFYNRFDKIGQFFLQDGSRKVEIELPYWMDMSKVIKMPEVRVAVFEVLKLSMGKIFPSEKDAQKCFSDKLCRDICLKNTSREAVEMAVLEIMEALRRETMEYLRQNHFDDIKSSLFFKRYVKSRTFPKNTPITQMVNEFLSGDKKSMYRLAEKYGVIKNGSKIFQYEEIRDHVRHSGEVKERQIKSERIYKDFCIALNQPLITDPVKEQTAHFGDNIALNIYLGSLSFIWTILDQHVEPNLRKKKSKEEYYADLVEKGILKDEEVSTLRSYRLSCNAVAHVNKFVKDARTEVLKDNKMFELANAVYERHRKIISAWINENTHV